MTGAATADTAAVDLLHCLGFVYLRHGQPRRAVVLLMAAAGAGGERPELLRTLAAALLAAGMADQAWDALDRLDTLDPADRTHPMRRLMRARILLLRGKDAEARHLFLASPERRAA